MTMMIYVAGPITLPVRRMRENAVRACRVGELIVDAGMVPAIPHLSVFWGEAMAEHPTRCSEIPCYMCGELPIDHETVGPKLVCRPPHPVTSYTPSPNGWYSYEKWLDMCFVQLAKCDALFRMAGESKGADREVEFAKEHGIPVFYNLDSLVLWRDKLLT